MKLTRDLRSHRPLIIFLVLLSLALFSLASGTKTHFIQSGVKRAVALTAYPFLQGRAMLERGSVYTIDLFFNYNTLRSEHAALQEEIVRLREAVVRRAEIQAENQRLRDKIGFARNEPRLSLEAARVIESLRGMLTINRGRYHGIEPFMAVITKDGVVGVVTEVADLTAKVATLHHRDCNVGAMVKRNRIRAYDGIVHASGSDWNLICTMQYIDMKNDVRVNDLVVTSPESLFPSGYPIGRVSRVVETGTLWKMAEITPEVDPYSLDEVFVVLRAAPDVEDLAGPQWALEDVEWVSKAPMLPDLRPLQERMAP